MDPRLFPTIPDTCPSHIKNNTKFYPFFKDCIGALDGTHLPAVVTNAEAGEDVTKWRNRKGWISQNVLGVVDFLGRYTYTLAGWEGSAHDGRVLEHAVDDRRFKRPAGKFYLGDAGYELCDFCLTPFRGVRYHLKDWDRVGNKPKNYKELFNLRHSSLRNVVERSYGVVKKRFPLLVVMHTRRYPIELQRDIATTAFAVHSFIISEQKFQDQWDIEWDEEQARERSVPAPEGNDNVEHDAVRPQSSAMKLRKDIAKAMWGDYVARTN
jgi:hypothetical protein